MRSIQKLDNEIENLLSELGSARRCDKWGEAKQLSEIIKTLSEACVLLKGGQKDD